MKTLLVALLERTIAAILAKDWNLVLYRVHWLMNADLSGEDKHRRVIEELRSMGNTLATWLLDIAIKAAYAKLAKKGVTQ